MVLLKGTGAKQYQASRSTFKNQKKLYWTLLHNTRWRSCLCIIFRPLAVGDYGLCLVEVPHAQPKERRGFGASLHSRLLLSDRYPLSGFLSIRALWNRFQGLTWGSLCFSGLAVYYLDAPDIPYRLSRCGLPLWGLRDGHCAERSREYFGSERLFVCLLGPALCGELWIPLLFTHSADSLGSACLTKLEEHDTEQGSLSIPLKPVWGVSGTVGISGQCHPTKEFVVYTRAPKGSRACLCLEIIHLYGFTGWVILELGHFLTCFWRRPRALNGST